MAESSPATPYEAIAWSEGALRLLDQTLLPRELRYLRIDSLDAGCEAIDSMRVRGAPAIGLAAAYTLAVVARQAAVGLAQLRAAVDDAAQALCATRPTAVNLHWAVDRVRVAVEACDNLEEARAAALIEAQQLHEQQRAADLEMAHAGASLLPDEPSVLLTHCNTGPLATGGFGTALGVIIEAHRRRLVSDVLVDETRPRLQGARLTSWELLQHGVPHHVIADGAAASLIASRGVSAAFVGADRIAANGDLANKVGTYALAIASRHHGVPFYVVAPLSTVDLGTPDGASIPIEQRDMNEVLSVDGTPIAPEGARALNPAFDVTPADLVDAIVTEAGVLRPPYPATLEAAVASAGARRV